MFKKSQGVLCPQVTDKAGQWGAAMCGRIAGGRWSLYGQF